jgi:CheY-like chemotaxis protein
MSHSLVSTKAGIGFFCVEVHRQRHRDVLASVWEPLDAPWDKRRQRRVGSTQLASNKLELLPHQIMEPVARLPAEVLIVEDDPMIALDFEETILGFGVKAIRTAGSVTKALEMIADRAPDCALLDVGLVREKSFAVAERLSELKIPFVFVTGYAADVRLPSAFADRPRLPKPCSADALKALLECRPAESDGS